MDPRVDFVESVLGFRFENGFRAKYLELGEPIEDLDFWFHNAQIFLELDRANPISPTLRHDVLTLIESIRLDAQTLYPAPEGLEDMLFNTSAYQFSAEVESFKPKVIELVLAQEDADPEVRN